MAFKYADARNTTPWDALLEELADLTGQVYWLNDKIRQAETEDETGNCLRPGGAAWDWVLLRDERGKRRAQVAQAAIACGVAERMIQQVELQADLVYKAAKRTVLELGLSDDEGMRLLRTLAANIILEEKRHNTPALEAGPDGTLSLDDAGEGDG